MVGRPFTSSGCANCRKRKIKCDLSKPECARCIKRGTLCLGYDRDRRFLHHNIISQPTRTGETKRPVRQLIDHIKPLALGTEFSVSAEVRTQLFSTFMDTFFASNTRINGKDDSLYFLMARFPILAGESEALDRSMIALASSFLAKTKNDRWLACEGLGIYNTALNAMAHAIRLNSSPTFNMLYATIILHTFETMNNSDTSLQNCFIHVQGATAIIKQYDFKGQDMDNLAKAMLTRQKWAAAHFMINTRLGFDVDQECLLLQRDRSPIDQMFGLLVEWSRLRHDLQRIIGSGNCSREACGELLQRCFEVERKLHVDWLNGPALDLDGKPVLTCKDGEWQESSSMPKFDQLFYDFDNLSVAKTYLLYWVISLVTSRVIYEVQKLLDGHCDSMQMVSYAGKILRSVPYCIQRDRQMSAVHVVIFVLSQASRCYTICGMREEFERCQQIYHLIALRGFDMAAHAAEKHLADWYITHN
ncbi:hypothetical protein BDW59DRAFT_154990 [Aspergillus cavernicola]|uniref:Zn(2)-C6 fungal-type domain-containing protein n=1 Tax=Aspergillus cavernicola TaxID=176166 RepID=A0ABR4HC62_9EURO